jgi:uncharacterized membrane protein
MSVTLTPTNRPDPTSTANPTANRSAAADDPVLRVGGLASVLFAGAIFGFFYAWVCSTMWGLDDADPRVAIEAMQAMNASVRNAVFFPAFFLTPVVLGLTALRARMIGQQAAATRFGLGAVVYLLGGAVLTMALNVPMNEELAAVVVPESIDEAATIWNDYSGRWQVYNITRTVLSGVALLLAGGGLLALRRPTA